MEMSFRRRNFTPVRQGDEIDVNIEAVGEKGDGIAKVKGFVIFVPNTNVGDNVKIKIVRVLNKVGFGEVVNKAEEKPLETDEEKNKAEEPSEDSAEGEQYVEEDGYT